MQSTQGQKPENPLLLLGQYSDEDTEEESGKEISHDTSENSPSELDEQVKVDSNEGTVTEADKDKDENFPFEKSDQDNMEHPSSLEVQENVIIDVNPGNIRVCSGPDFLPVNPSKVNKLYIPRKYKIVKDNGDRSHEDLTTVKILASNSKVSKRYESRKTAYEQREYRLLRSRTETDVISKPGLQTTNRWMFWNRHA
ncbi:hypothetical protein LXL04_007869 [Taraxacum kok-saghyz]